MEEAGRVGVCTASFSSQSPEEGGVAFLSTAFLQITELGPVYWLPEGGVWLLLVHLLVEAKVGPIKNGPAVPQCFLDGTSALGKLQAPGWGT